MMLLRNEKALVNQATVIYIIIKAVLNKREKLKVLYHTLLKDARYNNGFILTNLLSFLTRSIIETTLPHFCKGMLYLVQPMNTKLLYWITSIVG
jgi:hypothetical protein